MERYIAIDIGASSGRHIVGWKENGELKTEEVYRFKNGLTTLEGHLTWDTEHLFREVKNGLSKCFSSFNDIVSVSIDTWGVDYVLMDGNTEIFPVYAYRDSRTEEIIDEVHGLIPFEKLYERTGMQFQTFNTIYQLYCDKKAGRLEKATGFLMIPEYLMYRLTGVRKKEYTNASTTGLINVNTKNFDTEITRALGLPDCLFTELYEGGTVLGPLKKEIADEVGGQADVVLCLTHDTASAVHAIDYQGPYISSGTWSLLGIRQKTAHTDSVSRKANFSNEGGIGRTFRYQKNIMGMWVVNNVCGENSLTPQELTKLASESSYTEIVNLDDNDFLAPDNMTETLKAHLSKEHKPLPETVPDLCRLVLNSLASCYASSLNYLEEVVGETHDSLVIVGGGANNTVLNELTEYYSKKHVIALPIEATAIGNLKIQMEERQ